MKRKKIRFRMSEWLFLTFGLFLIVSSLALLRYDYSLVMLFNLHLSPGDPFEASYYSAPVPTPTPAPAPSATPTPVLGESTKLSIYLVSPANQTVIARPKKTAASAMLKFKFEVDPKTSASTFELLFRDKIVQTFDEGGNSTGIHEISMPFPASGLYQWRVKAPEITSELRTIIIRD